MGVLIADVASRLDAWLLLLPMVCSVVGDEYVEKLDSELVANDDCKAALEVPVKADNNVHELADAVIVIAGAVVVMVEALSVMPGAVTVLAGSVIVTGKADRVTVVVDRRAIAEVDAAGVLTTPPMVAERVRGWCQPLPVWR